MGVGRGNVSAPYLRVGGCREGKCVSLVPACGWVSGGEMCQPRTCVWVGVGRGNVSASYLRVGGCREGKCVSLVPVCGWVSGGEMCQPRTCVWVGVGGGMCQPRTYVLVGVGRRNVSASYVRVGGCREEKCVSLAPTCV